MSDLPDPLTPADCDLRDFSRIMIDVNRLLGSSFNAKASRNPLAWMLGHKLWYRSWHQVPAASLPDDDDELCYLAELGFDRVSWDSVKAIAMHGWIKCNDGRLYHPVVAEAACDAWQRKLDKRYNTECARIKKHNQRHSTSTPVPDKTAWISSGCVPVALSQGTSGAVPKDTPRDVPKMSPGKRAPREGKGQGHPIIEEPNGSRLPALPDVPGDAQLAFERHDALRREFVTGARTVDLTPERRRHLAARLKEIGGLGSWDEVLAIIRGSQFLRGETSRGGFVTTIDWLLKPANLRKVREGNYDEQLATGTGNRNSAPGGQRSAIPALIEARAKLGLS